MNPVTCCPDHSHLRDHLEGCLPEGEQARLIAHLDHCETCRLALERLAAGDGALIDVARQVGQEAPATAPGLTGLGKARGREDTDRNPRTHPAAEEPLALDFLDPPDQAGHLGRLGAHQVLEVRGRGGMGVVLKAFEPALHRVVAIKVLAPVLAASATARQRFVREAQAAAAVRDEHVVAIHAVGEARGLPYLVMEYVDGPSLQERLDRDGALPVVEVLRIGAQVAQGLAAAHALGLVHRDVKPANILLENGVARVRLTDFGLARAAADRHLTQEGVVAGTPEYMAPEQACGGTVDHRADLFSLGSVLYAMCTGRPPFRASGALAILKRVCEDEPRPVTEVNPAIPAWLGEVIARLQAKDPARRFQSAAEVADLLSRYLAHLQHPAGVTLPTCPAPAGRGRARGRRRLLAASILLCAAAGLGFTEVTGGTRLTATVIRILTPHGILVVETDDPAVKVTLEGDGDLVITGAGPGEFRLRPGNYRLQATKDGETIKNEIVTITRGDKQVVKVGLESTPVGKASSPFRFTPPPPGPLDRLDPAKIPAVERFPWQPKELVAVLGEHRGRHWAGPNCVTFSPDGKRAASCGDDTLVYVWDADTMRLRALLAGHTAMNWGVAFSPDGRRLLSGGADWTVRLWDPDTGRELRRFVGHTGIVGPVAFSPDGRRALSAGHDRTVRLWDVETGKELGRCEGHTDFIDSVAFSPDGSHALSGGGIADKTMRLWELETGKEVRRFEGHTDNVRRVAFLPDGQRALSCSHDRTLRLWDVKTGKELRRFEGHTNNVHGVAVSPDGRRAVSGGYDNTLRFWDVETGKETRCIAFPKPVSSVAFSPDGRRVLSAGWDWALRLWDAESGEELHPRVGFKESYVVLRVAFSPDGRRLLASTGNDVARLWDVESGKEVRRCELPNTIWSVGFSADGSHALCAGGGGMVLWEAESGKELRRFVGAHSIWNAALSRDGRRVVTGGGDSTVRLWDVQSGRELDSFREKTGDVYCMALGPDGRRALCGSRGGAVVLWDLDAGRELYRHQGHTGSVWGVAYSPDGRHAAFADDQGYVRLLDLTGKEPGLRPLPKWHAWRACSVGFAPDATTLVSSGFDGRIVLWDVATGEKRREWQLPGVVLSVAFAPDGRHLAAANALGTVYILRLTKP